MHLAAYPSWSTGFCRLPVRLPAGEPVTVQQHPPAASRQQQDEDRSGHRHGFDHPIKDSGWAVSLPALSIHTAVTRRRIRATYHLACPGRSLQRRPPHRQRGGPGRGRMLPEHGYRLDAEDQPRHVVPGHRLRTRGLDPGDVGGLTGIGAGDGAADHQQGQQDNRSSASMRSVAPPHRIAVPLKPPQARRPPGTRLTRSHHGHQ